MLAIFLFSLVLIAIYSTWLLILKGSRLGGEVAASVQRARMAVRAIEDALLTVQMYNSNVKQYLFFADTSGDFAALSLVSHLPESFPGARRWGDLGVQRVSFYTQSGKDGGTELMMTLAPTLLQTNASVDAYTIPLAKDVSLFRLDFYDVRKDEWLEEWKYTNALPRLVQVTLGLGKTRGGQFQPQDVVTRLVSIPSIAVPGDMQGAGMVPMPGAGQPGPLQPGPGQPGGMQPGVIPGAGQPGFGQPGYRQPGVIQPGFGPQRR
jgi:hypothetical protein